MEAKGRAAAAQKKRLAKRLSELRSVTEWEGEAWALELDGLSKQSEQRSEPDRVVASAVSETRALWTDDDRETELDGVCSGAAGAAPT